MEPKISIITLGVTDLKSSVKFYRDGLKFPEQMITEEIAFFRLKGCWLALYPRESLAADASVNSAGSGFPGFTLAHNVKDKGEVDRVLSQAEAAGARIVKPARAADWGGYSGYFADPDGYLWEAAWNPHFEIE